MNNGKNARPTNNSNGVGAHESPMTPFRDQTAVLVDLAAAYSSGKNAAAGNDEESPDGLGASPA